MAVNLSPVGGVAAQFFTNSGAVLTGGKLFTYLAGTTTPAATYTSSSGVTAHTNPIVLDAAGRVPGGEIWLTQNVVYKFILKDSADVLIATYDNISGVSGLTLPIDSSNITYDPPFTNSVATNVEAKLAQYVSIEDFGAVGNGTTDDTAAIQAALNASKHVVVPAGLTPLISSTITVPSQTQLEFLGGTGNLNSAMPASYFIKKSTMTTVGILVSQRGMVVGGGLLCQSGNTGDGIQLIGNAAVLSNFVVVGAGRDGVLIGDSGSSANVNSTIVEYVKARNNGRHGIYVHHDGIVGIANANAGTLLQCTSSNNTQDGIRIGHAFWVSIVNCLTEINGGWGLYLSGVDNNSYPECRWTTVTGGDFNEGNVTGQVYDGSYFATFVQPDGGSVPTTARTGLQGGGYRTIVSSGSSSTMQGLTVETDVSGSATRPLIADGGYSGGVTYPAVVRGTTTASNGDGTGLQIQVKPNTGAFRVAANIAVSQATTNQDNLLFSVNKTGSMLTMLGLFSNASAVAPGNDNTYSLGSASSRWSVVYAATGTINTSDANQKQQIQTLSGKEIAVAKRLKSLIRTFKFNDAVAAKGDAARIHVGIVAQDVEAAFYAEGLDASHYGVFCSDTMEDGSKRLGVRYDELLAFIVGAM